MPAPSAEMQAFVNEIRKPRGKTVLEGKLIRVDPFERGAGSFGTPLLLALVLPMSPSAIVPRPGGWDDPHPMGGYLLTLLVLSPAELRSGGGDVHAARAGAAQAVRRCGFRQLHLALLLPYHRSGDRHRRAGDAQGDGAGRALAVRVRVAVLAARVLPLRPADGGPGSQGSGEAPWTAPTTSSASPSSA